MPFMFLSNWWLASFILIRESSLQADVNPQNYVRLDKIEFTLPYDYSIHTSLVCLHDIEIDINCLFWILKRKNKSYYISLKYLVF